MSQIRVNMHRAVNIADIRHETRNGRAVVVVPSATLPDDVVMNRIRYPADVIANGYQTLEGTLAPLGHPRISGAYVNAANPEAINGYHVGAWNENVRRENSRVLLDKVIDVERANSTEAGKRLMDAINAGEPIHTSTGLFLEVNDAQHEDYDRVATSMVADHDAFLLGEQGAATPDQGVGVFVNSAGEELEVVNSVLDAAPEQEPTDDPGSLSARLFAYARQLLSAGAATDPTTLATNAHGGQEDHDMTPEELKAALTEQAETIKTNTQAQIDASLEPFKGLKEQVTAMNAGREAAAKADHEKAVAAVVNAKLMDEDEAKDLPLNALNALVKTTKRAAPLAGGMATNGEADEFADYDLNANIEESK